MLTPEQQKIIADAVFYKKLQQSQLWTDMQDMFQRYEQSALEELRQYAGHDKEQVFDLVRRWNARCDFHSFFEIDAETAIDAAIDLAEESELDFEQEVLRSEMNG